MTKNSPLLYFLFYLAIGHVQCSDIAEDSYVPNCGQNRCVKTPFMTLQNSNLTTINQCGAWCWAGCQENIDCLSQGSGTGGCESDEYCLHAYLHVAKINSLGGHGDPCPCSAPWCFSSESTAMVEDKGKTLVKDIQVGDKVLTASKEYKTVYTVDHKEPNRQTSFLQIHTEDSHTIELTKSHMLFVDGKKDPVPASQVRVGHTVQTVDGPSLVTKVKVVNRKGIWNPITTDGTIIVDGFVTSAYNAPFEEDEDKLKVAGWSTLSQHDFIHLLMTPYRSVCVGLSLSFCDSGDNELNIYSWVGTKVLEFGLEQNTFFQNVMVVICLIFFGLLSFVMMNPFGSTLFAIAGTYYLTKKLRKEKVQ